MNLLLCLFLAVPGVVERAVKLANDSGRVTLIGESDSERLAPSREVPAGIPPVLAFRFMEGARRHRFGDLDLMVDDAGH